MIGHLRAAFEVEDLRPAEKLVLLALADCADESGRCWPSVGHLARCCCLSPRGVQKALRSLEEKALVRTETRRAETGVQASNVYFLAFSVPRTQFALPRTQFGGTLNTVRGDPEHSSPEAPIEPPIEPKGESKSPGSRSNADPRKEHPAIQAVREVTRRYPPRELWPDVIQTLGENPDRDLLEACRKAWLARGYNPSALTWALEWYPAGGPPGRGNGRGAPVEADAERYATIPDLGGDA